MKLEISEFIEPADVIILQMPFASLARPSIALGLLKAALSGSELTCSTVHANLLFAEYAGIDEYLFQKKVGTDMLLGEWIFSHAAFEDFNPEDASYLYQCAARLASKNATPEQAELFASEQIPRWREIRRKADSFIKEISEALLSTRPKIVACTSMFEQNAASLALLKSVKRQMPEVKTVIGGANCNGSMGASIVNEFRWVDIAFSGEADEVFLELCRAMLSSSKPPKGAITAEIAEEFKKGNIPEHELWADQVNMEKVPLADYGEYFSTLSRLSYRRRITPGLVLKGSRGCWWRPKKPCTFCSLNPGHRKHRSKSAEKTLCELRKLSEKHRLSQFEMTDNIVPAKYFSDFFPVLEKDGKPYKLFYETPPILKRPQVEAMSKGGVTWVQSGIEALDDDVLKVMNKGSNAIGSIATLKHFAEFGMKVVWHLLTGSPGEDPKWHLRTAAFLPLLHHLPPPTSTIPIAFFRHSPYHAFPENYGLELHPAPTYSIIYPLDEEKLKSLVFLFADKAQLAPGAYSTHKNSPEALTLKSAASTWLRISRVRTPILCSMDENRVISVIDTRPCAVSFRQSFDGLDAEILRNLVEPVPLSDLPSLVGASAESVNASLGRLKSARIILEMSGKVLSLLVPGSALPAPAPSSFPGGHVHGRGVCAGEDELYPGEENM